ncbi:MAG TPA: sigma-70 family RNA polymerase sigma factor [Gemmatimonadaceae bacterium]|nr:sigma-70 family RNA polymerase sigma factor [Gemmatimonadaceae bacterium]
MAQRDVDHFERIVLPHLDDAYTLARYLLRNEHDAQDAVQDAVLRALRHFDGYRNGDARAWLLAIVRNCCFTRRARTRAEPGAESFDDESFVASSRATDALAIERSERSRLERVLAELPTEFREVIVLREVQDLSYREIAAVVGVPIGTVMSRLARARRRLADALGIDTREAS